MASEEYRTIKFMEQESKIELESQSKLIQEERTRTKLKAKEEENIVKRQQVEHFRKKKVEEKEKFIQEICKERENERKGFRISVEKRKSIEVRNMKAIEDRQKQFQKMNNGRTGNSLTGKSTGIPLIQQGSSQRPKLPKPSQALPPYKQQ